MKIYKVVDLIQKNTLRMAGYFSFEKNEFNRELSLVLQLLLVSEKASGPN